MHIFILALILSYEPPRYEFSLVFKDRVSCEQALGKVVKEMPEDARKDAFDHIDCLEMVVPADSKI